MNDNDYCMKCGARLPEGSEYCPECGASRDGSPYKKQVETVYVDRQGYGRRPDTLGRTPAIILTYGILATLFGLLMFLGMSTIESTWDTLADEEGLYMGVTMAEFKSMATLCGAAFLVSGICAMLCAILAKRRQMFMVCLILCIVASVSLLLMAAADTGSAVLAVILMLIGLLMANRIYSNRDSFVS